MCVCVYERERERERVYFRMNNYLYIKLSNKVRPYEENNSNKERKETQKSLLMYENEDTRIKKYIMLHLLEFR